jgi:putative drug exporter of the RND superfamily
VLVDLVTGRRGRFVVIALWVVAAAVGFEGYHRLGDVTAAGQASFLPRKSQSTRTVATLGSRFAGGNDVPALVLFFRANGLTAADRAAIGRLGRQIDALRLRGATPALDPFLQSGGRDPLGTAGLISRDGTTALVPVGFDADVRGAVTRGVERVRALVRERAPPGLTVHVTGPAGVAVDLERAADGAGRTLLYVTVGLVLALLLAVYRAPALAVLPLLVVVAAYLVAAGLTYVLIEAGTITVNAEGTMLLLVLVFGAGTDYSLLMVNRVREELADDDDAVRALRTAVRATAPSIGAAGGTVIAAMLVLLLADLESTHWLGPVLAVGVAAMLLAAFTLLPATLAVLGRRAFWPARAVHPAGRSPAWQRVAGLVRRRPGLLIGAITAALVIAALGNLVHTQSIGFGAGAPASSDSSRGTVLLDRSFPPGLSAPLAVVVRARSVPRAVAVLDRVPGVDAALPANVSSASGLAIVAVILRDDPYSGAALRVVRRMRAELARSVPGASVGGITAENVDVDATNARDTRLIVPTILALVLVILAVLLRALAAPAYLVVTVILSFAATLGLATVLFTKLLGQDGLAFDLSLLAFIFLVALGVDYNIFLMNRAREASRALGTGDAMLRALVTTGPVVTGAGVVLAGTFSTLTLLPLEELVQIGGTVAIGIVLDTFVVRALLVPAITLRLGDRAWWPARTTKP